MGNLRTAAEWAATIELPNDGPLNLALEYDYITLARIQLAQGQLAEARQLLARLLPPAEEAGRIARAIEILAMQAVSASAQQDHAEALAALNHALNLAEQEGYIRTFIDEGEPMRLLLLDYQSEIKKQLSGHVERDAFRLLTYTDKLLTAFTHATLVEKSKPETILEPLSERELEILRLIATGRTNQEIADILVIALSTVKSHINNLYGKLGATNRVQAIAIARNNGLLSENSPPQ